MKNSLQKRLMKYSLAAGALLVTGASVNAQIVYTNIEDETINSLGESIIIDFNDDATVDMQVNIMSFQVAIGTQATAIRAMVPPLSFLGGVESNSVLLDGYAAALDSNYAVAADKNFEFNGWSVDMAGFWYYSAGSNGTAGNWMGTVEEKFLGVKFKIGANTHFGWIRVSTVANAANDLTATVHDFAYELTPDTQILTGDTGGVIPPTCSEISTINITQTAADVLVTPSANGNLYYSVLLESATAPTAVEIVDAGNSLNVTAGTQATINLIELTENTNYTAYLILDDGVVKTVSTVYDADFTTLAVGFEQLNVDNFNIAPNPSNGIFNINTQNAENLDVTVFDYTGKIVLQKTINSTNNLIDISNQAKGVYNIQISNGNSIITKKVVLK